MKTMFKMAFWGIIIAFFSLLIYQNLGFFLTKTALIIDLKRESWSWTIPGLENIYYFGICFLIGLLLAGFKGLMVKWGLNKTIKSRDNEIDLLQKKTTRLKTELDVFQHDPYIKKELEKKAIVQEPLPEVPLPEETIDNAQETIEEENKEDAKTQTVN